MSRLTPVDPSQANGKVKDLLDAVHLAIGATPNIFTAFANAPAALDGYLGLNTALSNGVLDAKLREKLALVTAGVNGCNYCASAHMYIGEKSGIDLGELKLSLTGKSTDSKTQAALTFATQLINSRGRVCGDDIQVVRNAGFSNEEVIEILAHVALNTFTNYFNEAFKTEIDFPEINIDGLHKAA